MQQKASKRQLMVAESVRRGVSHAITHDVILPHMKGVYISKATISPDLKMATVFVVCPYLNHIAAQMICSNLNAYSGKIGHFVAKHTLLRFTPKLHFVTEEAPLDI